MNSIREDIDQVCDNVCDWVHVALGSLTFEGDEWATLVSLVAEELSEWAKEHKVVYNVVLPITAGQSEVKAS